MLCDRFIDSSLAYQGYARGLGIDEVLSINQFAIGDTMPDVTIYFSIEPEEGLKRITSNDSREKNRLDLDALSHESTGRIPKGHAAFSGKIPYNRRIEKKELVIQDALQVINEALKNSVVTCFS